MSRLRAATAVTLTVTLHGEQAGRLLELACFRGVSIDDPFDELATMALYDVAASGFRAAPVAAYRNSDAEKDLQSTARSKPPAGVEDSTNPTGSPREQPPAGLALSGSPRPSP